MTNNELARHVSLDYFLLFGVQQEKNQLPDSNAQNFLKIHTKIQH